VLDIVLRSGGQTGVDRAVLDFAIRTGRRYEGWCPRGGWAEDHPVPPGLLATYPRLAETPSSEPDQRTAWNVRDSHATLILVCRDAATQSPGTQWTQQAAEVIFLRPCRRIDLAQPDAAATAWQWLKGLAGLWGLSDLHLNIAGPRESESPGIYALTLDFLARCLP